MTLIALGCSDRTPDPITELRRQAGQGDPEAQLNLGLMHRNGEGVLRDLVLAHMWFNIAGADVHGLGLRGLRAVTAEGPI